MLTDLKNNVAVITGGGSGIGAALAAGCANEAMSVVVSDIDSANAGAVADAIVAAGGRAIAVTTDVADPASVDDLAEAAWTEFGQVDLLCANAGVFQGGITWERSVEDWRWCMDVNVYGPIHCIQSFVPRMMAQDTEGHVVVTASVAAFISAPLTAPYTVSKAAAMSVGEVLAHDLAIAGSKIGASVLTPSAFDTGIATTAKVRQARYGVDTTEDAAATADGLAAMTSAGLSPNDAVQPVLDAVRSGEFLIPTKPSYRDQLSSRFEALLDRRLPPLPPVID